MGVINMPGCIEYVVHEEGHRSPVAEVTAGIEQGTEPLLHAAKPREAHNVKHLGAPVALNKILNSNLE
jgi:hypothetical protein